MNRFVSRHVMHPGGTCSAGRGVVAYLPDHSLAIVPLANVEPVDLGRVDAAITAAWHGAVPPSRSH